LAISIESLKFLTVFLLVLNRVTLFSANSKIMWNYNIAKYKANYL